MTSVHPVYAAMATTIFEHMSGLARELGAINLGQGFPDDGPGTGPGSGGAASELLAMAARALVERSNQYPPGAGLPALREALAGHYRARQGLELGPGDFIVTSGATEAIAAAVLALVNPGDEAILFQPAYDAYAPMVRRAGGVPVSVRLRPPGWRYDQENLAAAITPATRAILFNDPLNPAGSIASGEELAMIAELCVAHDLVAICDEVWEMVRFDGAPHRSLASFPGMAQRTVKIGSAGKIFGLTGWKVGWMASGAPAIRDGLARAHQFLTYTTPPALQWAVAEGLALPDDWFARQLGGWAASRERLRAGLEQAGLVVLPNAATWFLCVDLAASAIALDDREFCERAVREAGVAAIPLSALYEADDAPRHIVRFCFTKPDAMLDEASARLATFAATLRAGG